MSKKLDWFKFSATDWLSGSVQLLSDGEKGTFIDLIAMIWKEQGSVEVSNILYRKLRLDNATACDRIKSYCELGILAMRDNKLSIKFIDNQIQDIQSTSKKNSENAKKRWNKTKPECDRMPIREEKKREEKKRTDKKKEEKEQLEKDIQTVLNHLNRNTKSRFRNAVDLPARFKEGYTVDDALKVIDTKIADWLNTEQQQYLRPQTLFCKKHFDSYLNQLPAVNKEEPVKELSLLERIKQRS